MLVNIFYPFVVRRQPLIKKKKNVLMNGVSVSWQRLPFLFHSNSSRTFSESLCFGKDTIT